MQCRNGDVFQDIKSINLENCYKSVSSDNSIITVLKKCQDTLHFLNISRYTVIMYSNLISIVLDQLLINYKAGKGSSP